MTTQLVVRDTETKLTVIDLKFLKFSPYITYIGFPFLVQNPWQPQNGLKCRQVSYTLGLTSGPMGPKEVQVTETQVIIKQTSYSWVCLENMMHEMTQNFV